MKEKGSAIILFILSLLIASGGIVGSSLVVKKYYPSLISNSANNNASKSSQDIQSSDKSLVATPIQLPQPSAKGNNKNPVTILTPLPQPSEKAGGNPKSDPKAIDMVNKIRNTFACHLSKFGKYPATLSGIDKDCALKSFDSSDKNVQGYSMDNYVAFNNWLNYSVELTIAPGKGFTITDKGSNYIELSQAEVNASMLRMQDATRVVDLSNLKAALDAFKVETVSPTEKSLCYVGQVPCFGDSRTGSRSSDGTGWIKAKLSQKMYGISTLPVDPVNNDRFHYVYCSDGKDWEINALLESDITSINKMKNDGGDDDTKYEVGSNLNLINKIPGCKY